MDNVKRCFRFKHCALFLALCSAGAQAKTFCSRAGTGNFAAHPETPGPAR